MLSAAIAVGMGCLDPEILFLEIYPKEIIKQMCKETYESSFASVSQKIFVSYFRSLKPGIQASHLHPISTRNSLILMK